jgi:hypothetical protein
VFEQRVLRQHLPDARSAREGSALLECDVATGQLLAPRRTDAGVDLELLVHRSGRSEVHQLVVEETGREPPKSDLSGSREEGVYQVAESVEQRVTLFAQRESRILFFLRLYQLPSLFFQDYDKYEKSNDYDYMTTLSLPVYSRRKDDVDIIGVAGVDVSIKLLYSLIPHHTVSPFTLSPLKLKESFPDRSQRIRFHHHKQRIHPDASRTQTRGINDCCCCCSCYQVGSSLRTSRSRRSTEWTYSRWKY